MHLSVRVCVCVCVFHACGRVCLWAAAYACMCGCNHLCTTTHPAPPPTIHPQVYRTRPQLVSRHAVPASFALLHEARADMRSANARLLGTLSSLLGPAALQEQVAALPSPTSQQRAKELLTGAPRG